MNGGLECIGGSFEQILVFQNELEQLGLICVRFAPAVVCAQELASCCEHPKSAGGPVSQMELQFDDDDDEEEKADAGVDHIADVSVEFCQAQTGSRPTEDTEWDAGL